MSILTPTFQEKAGNPVLMHSTLFAQLQNLSGDAGGRVLKQTYAEKTERVPVSHAGILIDFNTPAHYNKIQNPVEYRSFELRKVNMSKKELKKLSHILGIKKNSVIAVTGGGGKTTTIYKLAREVADDGWSVLITTTTAMLHPDLESRDYDQLFITKNPPIPPEKKWDSGITVAARIFDHKTGKTLGFDPDTINRLSAAAIYDLILVEADGAKNRPIKAPADHEPVIPNSTDMILGLIGLDALDKTLNEDHVHRPQQLSDLSGVPLDSPITGQVIESLIHSPLGIFKGSPAPARKIVILNKAAASDHTEQGREIGEAVIKHSDQIEAVLICEMQSLSPVLDWIKPEK